MVVRLYDADQTGYIDMEVYLLLSVIIASIVEQWLTLLDHANNEAVI